MIPSCFSPLFSIRFTGGGLGAEEVGLVGRKTSTSTNSYYHTPHKAARLIPT